MKGFFKFTPIEQEGARTKIQNFTTVDVYESNSLDSTSRTSFGFSLSTLSTTLAQTLICHNCSLVPWTLYQLPGIFGKL